MGRKDFTLVPDVAVTNILLDTENARIRAGHDQKDCITRILRKPDQLLALAKSIVEDGLTTMPILVSPVKGDIYIVRDGNRRMTALKLLNDPELCPDPGIKVRFVQLRATNTGNIPEHVDVLSSSNEEAIFKEVVSRHSGAQEGAGQLDWSAYLRAVYLLANKHPADYKRAAQYALWAEQHDLYVGEDFPISTLTRFFTLENLRLLGFEVDPETDELKPTISIDLAKRMASTVLNDFQSGAKDVNSVREPAQGVSYIESIRRMHGVGPASTPAPSPAPAPAPSPSPAPGPSSGPSPGGGSPAPAPGSSPSPAPTPAPAPTPNQAPADRKRLFGSRSPGIAIPPTSTKASSIVVELRKLDVKETPMAATMLLRALIELSDNHFRAKQTPPIADKGGLRKNVIASATAMHALTMLTDSEFDIVKRVANDTDSLVQIESLQKIIHRATHHSDYRLVNTFWDNFGCFVRACWR
ncbi:MAG: ParB/Srx family N-terminal domain-containing protein [Pseudomonadota bacterium]|nr:ParB/Srx family N-terminal domain-containing protein [Pseudomonadota bacterium]